MASVKVMFSKTLSNFVFKSRAAKVSKLACITITRTQHTAAAGVQVCPMRGGRPEDLAASKPFNEMPGPKIYPIIGTAYIYKPIGKYSVEEARIDQIAKYRKYGPIYREKIGSLEIVHLYDPKDMKTMFRNEGKYPVRGLFDILWIYHTRTKTPKVLVAVGEEHHYYRSKIQQQLLRPDMVNHYLDLQGHVADDFITRIVDILDENREVNSFDQELFKYACEAVATVAFDTRLNCMTDHMEPEIQEFIDNLNESFLYMAKGLMAFPWYKYFRSPLYRKFEKVYNHVNRVSAKYTEVALQELQQATADGKLPEKHTFLMSLLGDGNMTVDEAVIGTTALFVGGVESTAKSLGCVLYLCAKNPEKQENLRKEINAILPDRAPLCGKTLARMPYLKAFVKECHRIAFPTAFGNARMLDHDVVMSGYRVPAGTQLLCNCNAALRLPEYFPDPDAFKPERWLRNHAKRHTLDPTDAAIMLLPFGKGIRSCLGKRFAEQEIFLALVKVLQHFRVEYHYEDIKMQTKAIFTQLEKSPKLRFVSI